MHVCARSQKLTFYCGGIKCIDTVVFPASFPELERTYNIVQVNCIQCISNTFYSSTLRNSDPRHILVPNYSKNKVHFIVLFLPE